MSHKVNRYNDDDDEGSARSCQSDSDLELEDGANFKDALDYFNTGSAEGLTELTGM